LASKSTQHGSSTDQDDRACDLLAEPRGFLTSVESWNWSVLGRCVIAQVDHNLVDEAPTPALRRIITFDHGVLRGVEMLGCVAMRGIIAAPDMAADPAETQMHPFGTHLQAFRATASTRHDDRDLIEVGASLAHG
jgi:hypothetical protein